MSANLMHARFVILLVSLVPMAWANASSVRAEDVTNPTADVDADFRPQQDQLPAPPPAEAIVLLGEDGTNRFLSMAGEKCNWSADGDSLTSTRRNSRANHTVSQLHFRDAEIHVEFQVDPRGGGNSGVYIHGNYELQILDSYGKTDLSDADEGAVYGFSKPLANAARKPGEWQVYDIRYRAPRRDARGRIVVPGSITAWLNGQLVQRGAELGEPRSVYHPYVYGTTPYLETIWRRQKATMIGPVFLQDHDSPARFRNVWVRPLDDLAFFYEPKDAERPVLDLILVAGQSNAVGYDAKPEKLPEDPTDKETMFWWKCGDPPPDDHDSSSGGKWTHLQPQPKGQPKTSGESRQYGNFAQGNGGFGPEIGLARTLRTKEGQPLAVVKAAFSGTGMNTDWNPQAADETGACYRALVKEVKSAIAAAREQGITLRPRALAWVQGESDANPHDAPKYAERLGAMLTQLRKDIDAPGLIALLAVNTHFGQDNPHVPAVVAAQKSLGEKLARCAYVDTSECSIANNAHFDAAGTLDMGRRFAEALMALEKRQEER